MNDSNSLSDTNSSAAPRDDPNGPGAADYPWNVPPGWKVTWPDPPSPRAERIQQVLGIATAACSTIGVTLLVVWLWGSSEVPTDRRSTVVVTYEPLESAPPARGDRIGAPAPADSPGPQNTMAPTAIKAVSVAVRDRAAAAGSRPSGRSSAGSVSPSASTADTTGLVVVSEPAGARVTINGVGYGITPTRISYPPRGPRRIRVTKDGFETEERYFGPETSMSGTTLRVVLRQRVNWVDGDDARDAEAVPPRR